MVQVSVSHENGTYLAESCINTRFHYRQHLESHKTLQSSYIDRHFKMHYPNGVVRPSNDSRTDFLHLVIKDPLFTTQGLVHGLDPVEQLEILKAHVSRRTLIIKFKWVIAYLYLGEILAASTMEKSMGKYTQEIFKKKLDNPKIKA